MKRFDPDLIIIALQNRIIIESDSKTKESCLFLIDMFKAGIVDEAEKADPDPIIEVYNKFKLSDVLCYPTDENIHNVFYECFQAIKKYAEGKGKK